MRATVWSAKVSSARDWRPVWMEDEAVIFWPTVAEAAGLEGWRTRTSLMALVSSAVPRLAAWAVRGAAARARRRGSFMRLLVVWVSGRVQKR